MRTGGHQSRSLSWDTSPDRAPQVKHLRCFATKKQKGRPCASQPKCASRSSGTRGECISRCTILAVGPNHSSHGPRAQTHRHAATVGALLSALRPPRARVVQVGRLAAFETAWRMPACPYRSISGSRRRAVCPKSAPAAGVRRQVGAYSVLLAEQAICLDRSPYCGTHADGSRSAF